MFFRNEWCFPEMSGLFVFPLLPPPGALFGRHWTRMVPALFGRGWTQHGSLFGRRLDAIGRGLDADGARLIWTPLDADWTQLGFLFGRGWTQHGSL